MNYFWVYIVCGVFIAMYGGRILFQNRRIEITGCLPGRIAGTAIVFAVAAVLVIWRKGGADKELYYMIGAMLLTVVVFCFLKSGIGPHGVYINGKVMPFAKMEYFAFEAEMKDLIRVRVHTALKDTALYFKISDKEAVREYFQLAKVPDFDKMGSEDFKKNKKKK